jgi:hypothetical protein
MKEKRRGTATPGEESATGIICPCARNGAAFAPVGAHISLRISGLMLF